LRGILPLERLALEQSAWHPRGIRRLGPRDLACGLGPEIDITVALIRSRITLRYCRDVVHSTCLQGPSIAAAVCRTVCSEVAAP
jgi:hypothetical protein